jgi:hypothetical protein
MSEYFYNSHNIGLNINSLRKDFIVPLTKLNSNIRIEFDSIKYYINFIDTNMKNTNIFSQALFKILSTHIKFLNKNNNNYKIGNVTFSNHDNVLVVSKAKTNLPIFFNINIIIQIDDIFYIDNFNENITYSNMFHSDVFYNNKSKINQWLEFDTKKIYILYDDGINTINSNIFYINNVYDIENLNVVTSHKIDIIIIMIIERIVDNIVKKYYSQYIYSIAKNIECMNVNNKGRKIYYDMNLSLQKKSIANTIFDINANFQSVLQKNDRISFHISSPLNFTLNSGCINMFNCSC